MSEEHLGFRAGRFFCRILSSDPSDSVNIDDFYWDEGDQPLYAQNTALIIRDKVKQQIDLGSAPFSSWILARLWFLTSSAICDGLGVDEEGNGWNDGGVA